jgi:flagellar basal-body rod modification protein FlgD
MNLGAQAAGSLPLKWDGFADDGTVAKTGNYKFEVTASTAGQGVTADVLNYAEVMSVSNSTSGVKLNLSNSVSVSTSDVKEIY